ncbi:hypothetical protein MAC_07708 [Metarhizium acridum CQMa 102]|uniref:Aminoglycoside phosphotransferase domain-containing protein n=1 Tax=Metarhizium acridum (strain CQMa 102) TaxID=655827 RepID=E9ECW0_METAQ|nr:uncharacterized protein MAC_07708 [Metarhizium acridum CQMa 102]EFY86254.1 hypothetical protein MAC_07708 [Metarhizium acridum CQMa 102]
MADSLPLGNAAWTGVGGCVEEYAERINKFVDKIDSKALESYASSLRGNQPCTISAEFSVGNFNLVRKIQFRDGVECIVRLRMPPMPVAGQLNDMVSPQAREKRLLEMESELATMEFVRRGGITELSWKPRTHPRAVPREILTPIANIMTQLASVRLPKIGSIFRDAAGSFVVGPLIETGSGPYDSAAEFYADYPLALGKTFRSLAASFPPPAAREGRGCAEDFGLANYDLNPNNVLVDREFNILAVIDWDSVVSVPDAALYRFSRLMGVGCAIPGVVGEHGLELKRDGLGRQFAKVVEAWGEQARKDCQDVNSGPLAFRSLISVKQGQDFVNEEWMQGLAWLSDHSEQQVAHFYLGKSKDRTA